MKYEFASAGWMAFMHGMIAERVKQLGEQSPPLRISLCEVFTDPPRHLSPDGSPIAWHCVLDEHGLRFGAHEVDDVLWKVRGDYGAILPLGRYDTRGDPDRAASLARMGTDLVARGLMAIEGDRSLRDPRVGSFHDEIARVTA